MGTTARNPARPTRRDRVHALGVASALVVAAIAVGVLLHGRLTSVDLTPTRQVPLPSVDAGPRQVVRVYLSAYMAHDFDTTRALVDPAARDDFKPWFTDPLKISEPAIGRAFGRPSELGAYLGETDVAVTFELADGDVSMPSGHTLWGYQVHRVGPSHRWMIYGQGMG